MKAVVERDEFAGAVVWAARYAPAKPLSGYGALSGLLVRAADGALTVVGADGDTWATATVPARVHDEGTVLLPARLVSDVAAKLPQADVELSLDESEVTLTCGTLSLTTPTVPAADYPVVPGLPPTLGEVDAAPFAAAVARVAVATSKEDDQPYSKAVYLEGAEDGLRMSSTDRYRIARTTVEWKPAAGRGADAVALVPVVALADLAKSASGTVGVHLGDDARTIGLTWPGRQVTTGLISTKLPGYDRVLNAHAGGVEATLTVDRQVLADALGRVAVVYEGGKAVPRLHLDLSAGELTVRVGTDRGRTSESVAVVYDGQPRSMQCNAYYLEAALKSAGGDVVRVGLTPDAVNSLVFHGETDPNWVHMLVMLRDPAREER